jgi:O-antigen/teichoic acid export membrane protein
MKPVDVENIAGHSIRGSLLTLGASLITMVSGFARSVLLARLLLPENFGVLTQAAFFVSLVSQLQRFGLEKAFVHHQDESAINLGTFASLRVGLAFLSTAASLAIAPLVGWLYPHHVGIASVLAGLALVDLVNAFNAVPQAILTRRLSFRRLAALDVASSLTMTLAATGVAWLGGGVWALVVEKAAGVLVSTVGLWVYRRPWKPDFRLDRRLANWYLGFGKQVFISTNLAFLLDQFDDFWTGTALGVTAQGFYSRAYEFARYPRRVLAGPILTVFFPVFAGLQHDRTRLSKAFYRVCSAIVRVGFPVFGSLGIVAPEFVHLFLGDKWLPMVSTFRLMLVYTLLDPLCSMSGNLLSAIGQPRINTQVQLIRTIVFLPSVVLLAYLYGINGVAVAADLMLLLGIVLWFRRLRPYIDFSIRRIFLVPFLGLALGSGTALLADASIVWTGDWIALIAKTAIVLLVYAGLALILERKEYLKSAHLLWTYLCRSRSADLA